MSVLQQPYIEKSAFRKNIAYFSNTNQTNLNTSFLAGSLSYSNEFAQYSPGVITITKSGFYSIYCESFIYFLCNGFIGNIQMQLSFGSNIVSIQAGNALTELNDFGVTDYCYFGSTGVVRLPATTTLANNGITVQGIIYYGSNPVYLNQNDTVNFKLITNISSTNLNASINGFVQISSLS